MKKIKRWVYYCDFCKKSLRSSYHMRLHEEACTANPNRRCGGCGTHGIPQEYKDAVLSGAVIRHGEYVSGVEYWIIENQEKAIEALRDVTDGCPFCMLATLRSLKCPAGAWSWSFKAEKKDYWSAVNADREGLY